MRVFVTRQTPGDSVDRLREQFDVRIWSDDSPVPAPVLAQEAAEATGLLTMLTDRIDESLLAGSPNLRIVSNCAVGFDNIDVAAATRHRVLVCNTPGVLVDATADLAFALILASARRLTEAERVLRNNTWHTWSPTFLLGGDVSGRTLGVIGLGAIGSAVVRRAQGFSMAVLYTGRRQPEKESALGVQWRSLDDLLAESDFVSLHVPLNDSTRHLIDAQRLRAMKPSAFLINTARGAVVDQQALYEALRDRRIAGAGLDVFETEPLPPYDPLRTLDNVVLVPHIGSATVATRVAMANLAAENLSTGLSGALPRFCVNPEAWSAQV